MNLWKKMCTVLACLAGFTALGALENLPDVSTLDKNWAKDAIRISQWSWAFVPDDGNITRNPFKEVKPGNLLALPYNKQYMEIKLRHPELLSRIVLDACQVRNFKIKGDELDQCVIYTSVDGKEYKPVTPKIENFFYKATDYKKKTVLWNRISLTGDFYGRYFRIYVPWKNKRNTGYIYGVKLGPQSVKAFAAVDIRELSVPFSTDGKFVCSFVMNGNKSVDGKVTFKVKNGAVLAEKKLSDFADGKFSSVMLELKNTAPGLLDLEMIVERGDGIEMVRRAAKITYFKDKTVLKPAISNSGITKVKSGLLEFDLLTFKTAGDKVEYKIPAAGCYAVYAVIRGQGSFTFTAPGVIKKNVLLDLWAPKHDSNRWVTGENFIGIYDFKSGDTIAFTARTANAQLGEVFIIPATAEQKKIFTDKTPAGSRPSIIIHDDGFSDFFFKEWTYQMCKDRVERMSKSNIIAYDWCVGTSATNYQSKFGTMFGQQRNIKFTRERDRLAAERVQKLNKEAGKDSVQIYREETARHNIRYTVTLRPNVFYGKDDPDKNAQYFIDHPEFGIVQFYGKLKKPSYAYKEVRDFYLGMAKEIAAYKPDALVIEFLRHPIYFGFDPPLIEKYKSLYGNCTKDDYMNERWINMIGDIMLEWLREVRTEIKKIHPAIELEINVDCENSTVHGIPVARILEAGLVEAVSPGFYHVGPQKLFPLAPYREMIRKSPIPVKLYPRVETVIVGHDPTPEEEAGLVKRPVQVYCSNNQWKSIYYHFMMDGADGLRPFNAGGPGMADMLNDWAEVKRFVVFTEPLLDVRRFTFENK